LLARTGSTISAGTPHASIASRTSPNFRIGMMCSPRSAK
jgi:hypothetical protein